MNHNTSDNKKRKTENHVDLRILTGTVPYTLLLSSFLLILLSRLSGEMSHYCFYFQVALAGISHLYLFVKLNRKRVYIRFLCLLVLFLLSFLLNYLFVKNISFKQIIFAIVIMPSIAMLMFFIKCNKMKLHIFFFFACLVIALRWIITKTPESITINSRNYVVYYLFLYALPYYYYCSKERELPIILYPMLCILTAILAIGRGGIIMSLILMIGWMFGYIGKAKHKYIVITFICLCSLGIVFSVVDQQFLDRYFSRFQSEGIIETGRETARNEYIGSLTELRNIIFGSDLKQFWYIQYVLNGSLHNSFLTVHARIGIVCVVYYILLLKGLIVLFKEKSWFLLFFYIAVLTKAFIDADFPGVSVGGDIYVYLLFLISLSQVDKREIQIYIDNIS